MAGIKLKTGILLILSLALYAFGYAQKQQPVKWNFEVRQVEEELFLVLEADIAEGWHLYSQHLDENEGPVPTAFDFSDSEKVEFVGEVTEPEAIVAYDQNFGMDLRYFEQRAEFKQKFKLKEEPPIFLSGKVYFMACDDEMCLPPNEVEFSLSVK